MAVPPGYFETSRFTWPGIFGKYRGLARVAPLAIFFRAAPAGSVKEFLMYYGHSSLWGILVLVADIWAIVNIFQSSASTERKVLWTVLVILLPVLGFIIWLFAGPRTGKS
jgi:hypothetical protein